MPGVKAILTGEDTAAFKTPPPMVTYPGKGGAMIKVPHRDVIARKRVRYVGQEVALVVASSAAAAQDAAEAIEVEYRDLPAVVDAEAALEPARRSCTTRFPAIFPSTTSTATRAATEAAFARAAHVTRLTLDSTRDLGHADGAQGLRRRLRPARPRATTSTASTQGMSMMLPNFVRHHRRAGGQDPRPCARRRRRLRHPLAGLSRVLRADARRAQGRHAGEMGRLALRDHRQRLPRPRRAAARRAGARPRRAFPRPAHPLGGATSARSCRSPGRSSTRCNPATHAINVYRIPALYGRHRLALTNTTPTTAYRGAGRPNVSYLVERLVEEAAREIDIDRIELRRRNLIPKEAFPYKTPVGSIYDSGDPAGELEEALEQSDWDDFETRRNESAAPRKAARHRLRGVREPSGAGAAPKEEAVIKFGDSGNATLHVLAGPSGQGHETVLPEVVAQILGFDPEQHHVEGERPGRPGAGRRRHDRLALHDVARRRARRDREGGDPQGHRPRGAASSKSRPPTSSSTTASSASRAPTSRSRSRELARRYAGAARQPRQRSRTPTAFPGGAHVAEVEIDRETGEVEVVRYVAVDDCGRVLNHVLLDGQLHGGIVQGLGQALVRALRLRPASGQLLTGSFMDYAMPRAGDPDARRAARPLGAFAEQSARREGRGRGRHHRRAAGGGERGDRRAAPARHPSPGFPVLAARVWKAMHDR